MKMTAKDFHIIVTRIVQARDGIILDNYETLSTPEAIQAQMFANAINKFFETQEDIYKDKP